MNFYPDGNYLIIHGGRNDLSSESFALSDTYVLELQNMEWIEVKIYSNSPSDIYNRCGHKAVVYSK